MRLHPDHAQAAFDFLRQRLEARNSHARLLAVAVLEELVARSAHVREALAEDLGSFFRLCLGISMRGGSVAPLPPPATGAIELRKRSLAAVELWSARHGRVQPRFRTGFRYLREGLGEKGFPGISAEREEERAAAATARREAREEEVLRAKFMQLRREAPALMQEMRHAVAEVEACLKLIVPDFTLGTDGSGEVPAGRDRRGCGYDGAEGDGDGVEWESGSALSGNGDERGDGPAHEKDNDGFEWESGSVAPLGAPATSVADTILTAALGSHNYSLQVEVSLFTLG